MFPRALIVASSYVCRSGFLSRALYRNWGEARFCEWGANLYRKSGNGALTPQFLLPHGRTILSSVRNPREFVEVLKESFRGAGFDAQLMR